MRQAQVGALPVVTVTLLLAPWVEETLRFSLDLGQWRTIGLAFLLGSFVVATLSDLKRLSAQREFLEVWVLFTLGVLAYDLVVLAMDEVAWSLWPVVAIKWGLILVLGLLSWQPTGALFKLARADVFASAAAASLLSPLLVLLFWVALKVFAVVLRPVLARGRPYWPFMPVVSAATVAVLVPGLLLP